MSNRDLERLKSSETTGNQGTESIAADSARDWNRTEGNLHLLVVNLERKGFQKVKANNAANLSSRSSHMRQVRYIYRKILGSQRPESEAGQMRGIQTDHPVETQHGVRFHGQAKLPSKPTIDAGTRRASVDNEFEMLRIANSPFYDDKIAGRQVERDIWRLAGEQGDRLGPEDEG